MSEPNADFITILSSELIATVVEAYFNDVMYKVPVKVVDLKPQGDGYAFSLAFVTKEQQLATQKEQNRAAIEELDRFYKYGKPLTDEEVAEMSENEVENDEMKEFAGKVAEMFDMVNKNGVIRDKKGRFITVKQGKE